MTLSIEREPVFVDTPYIPQLEGTAFNVNAQVELLLKHKDISKWIGQTQEDLEYLYLEFLAQHKVIPFDLQIVGDGLNKRLYCSTYNQYFLNDDEITVSWIERNGAPRVSLGRIEEFLLDSEIGAMAALISPPGWSGLRDESGQELVYPDTQIYLYKKTEADFVEAMTLVVDRQQMDLVKVEQYLGFWGQTIFPNQNNDQSRIANSVSSPLFFDATEKLDFFDFAFAVSEVCGSNVDQIIFQIKDKDQLRMDNLEVRKVINNFSQQILSCEIDIKNAQHINWLANLLRKTVLDMSAASRGIGLDQPREVGFYYNELERLQQASEDGPCPVTIRTAAGPRLAISGKEIIKCVNCPKCKRTVDAEVYSGEIHCPSCGHRVKYQQRLSIAA